MFTIEIALEEGFSVEHVTVAVDRHIAATVHADIRLLQKTGAAAIERVPVSPGRHAITLTVHPGGPTQTIDVDVGADLYVRLSLHGGALRHRVSTTPFGYA